MFTFDCRRRTKPDLVGSPGLIACSACNTVYVSSPYVHATSTNCMNHICGHNALLFNRAFCVNNHDYQI